MTKRLFGFLRAVNKDYGNVLTSIATLCLVVLTSVYVVLTWKSLHTLKKDYVVRSFPEIHVLTPITEIVDNRKVLKVILENKGFQATGLRLKVIPFVQEQPVEERIDLMYTYQNRLYYAEDESNKLGKDISMVRYMNQGKFEGLDQVFIYLRYDVPLQENHYAEWDAFGWNPNLNMWVRLPFGLTMDMLEKSRKKGLLSNF